MLEALALFFFFSRSLASSLNICASPNALYQLDSMANCRLGYKYVPYYRSYGCTCSTLNPSTPVDEIDQCCMTNLECYKNLIESTICDFDVAPAFCYYRDDCVNRQNQCRDNPHTCPRGVCECDKALMDCLARYPRPTTAKHCRP